MLGRILVVVAMGLSFVLGAVSPAVAECPEGQEAVCRDTSCTNGETMCGGQCTDTSKDDTNCGACGVVCKREEACEGGTCRTVCPRTQLVCGGVCVTPSKDPDHCGGCGQKCPRDHYCSAGSCKLMCPASMTVCGRTCRATKVDRKNCGACGKVCRRDEVCDGGQCVAACIDPEPVQKVDPKLIHKEVKKPVIKR